MKKRNKLAQAGRLPDGKGYFNQCSDVVSIMIYTLLGKKGIYLYKDLFKRKSGAAAADTKGRTDVIMFMSLVCGLGYRLLRIGGKCVRIGTGHTPKHQHQQA